MEVNGEELLAAEDLEQVPTGWRWHPERGWLEIKLRHGRRSRGPDTPVGLAVARVTLAGIDRYTPPPP